MNVPARILQTPTESGDAKLWYPLHPRWIPLLRLVGVLSAGACIYSFVLDRPWSLDSLLRWIVPVIFILSCLCAQPELRPRTFLNRVGNIAHLLLVFLVLPLALFALLTHWFRG